MLSHLRLQCKFANVRLFQRAFSPASTIALIGLSKPPALPVVITVFTFSLAEKFLLQSFRQCAKALVRI